MGTIVFKLTGQNADALKAFLELDEAQRKVITGSKNLAEQSAHTSKKVQESAGDIKNMGESMSGVFKNVLSVLGIGGGLMAALNTLKAEIAETTQELIKLDKVSNDIAERRAQTATSMPGKAEANIAAIRQLEKWAADEKLPYLKSEIASTIAAYAKSAGGEATDAQKIAATKSALGTKERYDPSTFAAVQGTLARAYPELLKDQKRLNDMTALLMETGQGAAAQLPGASPIMVMAKEAGLSAEETVSLLYGAELATGDVGAIMPYLRSLNTREKTILTPREVKPDTFKDPKELSIYRKLKGMSEAERITALGADSEARRIWYGKEISDETFRKAQFDAMSAEEQRRAIIEKQIRASDVFGARAAAMPTIFEKQDVARGRLAQSGVYEEARQSPDPERHIDIMLEFLKKKAIEDRAEAFDAVGDYRALVEAYQEAHPESRKLFGMDWLKIDPLTFFDKMAWGLTKGGTRVPTHEDLMFAASRATSFQLYEYMDEYGLRAQEHGLYKPKRFPVMEKIMDTMGKSVGRDIFKNRDNTLNAPTQKVELATTDSASLSSLEHEAKKTNTLNTFNIMNYPTY